MSRPFRINKWALQLIIELFTSTLPRSMALQVSQSSHSIRAYSSVPYSVPAQKSGLSPPFPAGRFSLSKDVGVNLNWRRRRAACGVRCTLDRAIASTGQVTEVNKDNFWPIVRAAGDKIVVLDMYTQWYASYLSFFCRRHFEGNVSPENMISPLYRQQRKSRILDCSQFQFNNRTSNSKFEQDFLEIGDEVQSSLRGMV